MTPENTLKIWSDACQGPGVQWYLYSHTLLCAKGCGAFPDGLKDAQVAVFARDLPRVLEDVLPRLPEDWKLCRQDFVTDQRRLLMQKEGRDILNISLLSSVADPQEMAALTAKLNKIRGKLSTKLKLMELFGGPLRRWKKTVVRKNFSKLTELAAWGKGGSCCDAFTSKTPVFMEKDWFSGVQYTGCAGTEYPVFPGWKQYLSQVYGDYEKGLLDDIGCGLTAEEKDALRQHQKRCVEALAFVQRVAREFDLRYYLLAGSVLGTVRHGGFIPWDDDVDVGVRVEELEHFEEKLRQQLPAGFTLEQSAADHPYPRMFSKICCDGRCCIDIWPLVPTYIDGFKAQFTWYFAKIITKAHYRKIGHPVSRFGSIVKPMCAILSDRTIMKLARRNERKYAGKNAPAYINIYSIYRREKETIRREWLEDEQTALFHGIEVPIVGCTQAYLTHLYGDYMAFPPPWKRASRHVDRFGNYDKK